jgi:hypothetical protein
MLRCDPEPQLKFLARVTAATEDAMNSRHASLLVILSIPGIAFGQVSSAALNEVATDESKAVLPDVIRNTTPV